MATRPRVPSIEQSIAEKYGIQETSRWTGQPIPQEALLTPEEQEYLKTMPKPPSVPSVPSIPMVTGVGGVGGESTRPQTGGIQPEVEAPSGTTLEAKEKPEEIKPTGAGLTIPMTQAELNAVAQHNAEATCAGDMQRVNTYKVSGWDDAHNWTQLYIEAVDKKSAKAKAVDAGYNVKQVTRQITKPAPAKAKVSVPSNQVEVKDGKTGETLLFPKSDWESLPDKYKNIVKSDGIDAMVKAFNADHVQSKTGEYMTNDNYSELQAYDRQYGTSYASTFENLGYNECMNAINADEKARNDAIAKLDKYKTEDGYNLLKARTDGIKPETMERAGFDNDAVNWADGAYEESIKTGVALPGDKTWENIQTSEVISDAKYKQIVSNYEAESDKLAKAGKMYSDEWDALGPHPSNKWVLSTASARRLAITGVSTLFFAPAIALLPEVKVSDIKPITWAVGGAQLATWAMPVMPKGIVPIVSAGAAGTFGYATAKNWDSLSKAQKALAVAGTALVSLPALAAATRLAGPAAVKVPTNKGTQVTIWRGFQVNGKPIIGITEGKLAIGTKGVKLPMLAEIEKGWHPVTKIETTMLGTQKALKKMGVSNADIAKVVKVWKEAVPIFARKPSPSGVTPSELVLGSERLTPEEVATVLKVATSSKYAKKIDMIYGSSTIRTFLKKALRGWRKWHDIDIQTNLSAKELPGFVDDVMKALRKAGAKIRLSADNPGVVEKMVNGRWVKITDIHTKDILPGSTEAWETGAYGYAYAEKPVTIKLPSVGKLKLMTLSETGLRKAGSMTRFQATEISPYSYRLNDIADFYVIVLNYKGTAAAEKVAKAFGYTPNQLLEAAVKNPRPVSIWALSPSTSPAKGLPSVSINIPVAYTSTIPLSLKTSLAKYTPVISATNYVAQAKPSSVAVVSPSGKMSPSLTTYPISSAAILEIVERVSPKLSSSKAREISSKIVASVSPLVSKGVSSAKISTSISKSLSPYVSSGAISSSAASSISKSVSSSVSVSPYITPSPSLSVSPSPSPSVRLSPSPTISPSPMPTISPPPKPPPRHKVRIPTTPSKRKRKLPSGPALATWRQGMYWVSVFPPFRTKGTKPDVVYSRTRPHYATLIAKGRHSPRRTLRGIGKVPPLVEVPMGVVTARIRNGRKLTFTRRRG